MGMELRLGKAPRFSEAAGFAGRARGTVGTGRVPPRTGGADSPVRNVDHNRVGRTNRGKT